VLHETALNPKRQVEIATAMERQSRIQELIGHEIFRQTKGREAKMTAIMREQRKWEERTYTVARLIREMEARKQVIYFRPVDIIASSTSLAGMLTSKMLCLKTNNDADLAERRLRKVIKSSFRSPLP